MLDELNEDARRLLVTAFLMVALLENTERRKHILIPFALRVDHVLVGGIRFPIESKRLYCIGFVVVVVHIGEGEAC